MKPGELLRVRAAFGALSAVPLFLLGWLAWLQVVQGGTLDRKDGRLLPLVARTAERQAWREEHVPAPRGRIVDRNGIALAADCEAYEVRARVVVPRSCQQDVAVFRGWQTTLTERLARALVADPGEPDRLAKFEARRERLRKVFARRYRTDRLPASGPFPKGHVVVADFMVGRDIDRLAVIDALRSLDADDDTYPTVKLYFLRSHRREYPDRDLTHGLVGHLETRRVRLPDGSEELRRLGICGLETFAALEPGASANRRFKADGRGRPYFIAPVDGAGERATMHSTIDIEMQRAAVQELTEQAERGVRNDRERKAKWGALVLVEIATGDVLAAASWHRDVKTQKGAAFAPYQCRFEPGSIVKPLVLAYAHEVGSIDWRHQYDCNPHGSDYRETIAGLGRAKPVRDDHECGLLDAHGILVNSSNIGAAMIGLTLTREQWWDYIVAYGFGSSLGLRLPSEAIGGPNDLSFAPRTPLRSFRANSAISFSFGYELTATPLQIARAYLRMFRGLASELRLVRALELDGVRHELDPVAPGPQLRPEVREAVRAAMQDVVSNDSHATGYRLRESFLQEHNIELHGVVAGKTGTAASLVGIGGGRMKSVRNASFVGVLPAHEPRWLAVCVLQKDDSARFYGGSYAAPPVVKLLLRCQDLAERRQHQESQVTHGPDVAGGQTRDERTGSMSPGVTGWNAPVRTGASRDTR